MKPFRMVLPAIVLALAALASRPASAGEASIAVAANFTEPARELAASFKAGTGDDIRLSFGSSGQFYAQITQSAPFDVMLSADDERPRKLISEGLAIAGSRFTYAVGKLVLWGRSDRFPASEQTLRDNMFDKLSIADAAAAPYGAAAIETMKQLGIYDALRPKLVTGASIAQALQFVDSGNADLGFVALSQVINRREGSRWMVPQNLYAPIVQDAVLLDHGKENPVAAAFLAFLRGQKARETIARFGYALP